MKELLYVRFAILEDWRVSNFIRVKVKHYPPSFGKIKFDKIRVIRNSINNNL